MTDGLEEVTGALTEARAAEAHNLINLNINRILEILEKRDELNQDIKRIYDRAKADGLDVKAMRKLVSLLRKDRHDVEEEMLHLNLYWRAVTGEDLI